MEPLGDGKKKMNNQQELLIKQLKNKIFQRDLKIANLEKELYKLKVQLELIKNSQLFIN